MCHDKAFGLGLYMRVACCPRVLNPIVVALPQKVGVYHGGSCGRVLVGVGFRILMRVRCRVQASSEG